MKRKRIIIIILLGVLLLAGGGFGGREIYRRWPRPLPVRVMAVARVERLDSEVNADGTIQRVNLRTTQTTAGVPAPLGVELKINQTDFARVKMGQPARITVDALQNVTPLSGHVREVGLIALETRTKGPRKADDANFRVVAGLDDPPPSALTAGMKCEADILIESRSNALTLPIAALTRRMGEADGQGNYVAPAKPAGFIVPGKPAAAATGMGQGKQKEYHGVFLMGADHLAHFRVVRTGIVGDMQIEVLDGLKEGDAVIAGPPESMRQIDEWSWVRPETEN
jgi:HlyD family secretion protein